MMPTSRYVVQWTPGIRRAHSAPDALGKSLGLPVHALLGGKIRDCVEYSAYLFYFYRWAAHCDRLAALHRRRLDADGTMRERDDAAAMRKAEPGRRTPTIPRW
ncbi:hypothetical protein [Streptomyces sp. NBC_01618]|uniref:hypothetical protein n=1 Tax=Streptomyces sp. NBC_01618 TaxID=2975900 RepID=UPI003864A81F|nr:hypothetical protein OH735_06995 [Streptomyces sp. NBC_01618]